MKKIIIDTDIGCDCDDVLALAYALQAQKSGLCKLLGVTYCSILKNVPDFIRIILNQYKCRDIPIGVIVDYDEGYYAANKDNYAGGVLEKFPVNDNDTVEYEDAVRLLRRLLVELEPDEKVTIAAIGPLLNLANLLKSPADDISPLTGMELVKNKVDELVLMIGDFRTDKKHAEWNIIIDIKSTQYVMMNSPVAAVVLPYEVGLGMITGAKMVKRDGETTPASYSYILHGSVEGRHSWDPATVLYAIKGADPWFELSPWGFVNVDDKGFTEFTANAEGLHRFLMCKLPQSDIADEIDDMV